MNEKLLLWNAYLHASAVSRCSTAAAASSGAAGSTPCPASQRRRRGGCCCPTGMSTGGKQKDLFGDVFLFVQVIKHYKTHSIIFSFCCFIVSFVIKKYGKILVYDHMILN